MPRSIGTSVAAFLLVSGVMLALSCMVSGQTSQAADDSFPLLTIGKTDLDAINLKVWTNQQKGGVFKPGDRVIISFRTDQKAYVTAVNVSAKGDVAILFPNREHPDNRVEANKEYTLFGDDSQMKLVLGKGLPEARIGFYVSSEPLNLDPLAIQPDQVLIRIPADSQDKIRLLQEKLEKISKTKGFNGVLLSVKADEGQTTEIELMKPLSGPGLPGTGGPETVTGTQGRTGLPGTEGPETVAGTQGRADQSKKKELKQ